MNNNTYQQILQAGMLQMQIDATEEAQQKLISFVDLLAKWSKVYNLTTVREPEHIVTQHILDSLSLLPYLQNTKIVLDVGTGAGLPGIPLAIMRPDISFKLLDSQRKKINFVQHVITSLQLSNVTALHERVETLPADLEVDMIVSRAFSSLKDFVSSIATVVRIDSKIIAMKGRIEQAEVESLQLSSGFKLERIETLSVPGLNAERCLVFITCKGATHDD
jgi:16S rRNA (guanine527-N7)-methyltransferase